jgi:hypothetical protein
VVVNEVQTNTGDNDEYSDSIELYNTTPRPIDIGGWYLSDSDNTPLKFQIPIGTRLAPFGYVVFDEDDFNADPANPEGRDFGLSGARGDDVYLVIPDGQGGVQSLVDEVHFGAAIDGESLGRTADGTGRLVPMNAVTLGRANSTPRIGPVMITEIQYQPSPPTESDLQLHATLTSDDLEFVEVTNTTGQPLDLTEWQLRGGVDLDFDPGTTLDAGKSLLVVSFDPAASENATLVTAFRAHYDLDDSVMMVGGYQGRLRDEGEIVRLQRPDLAADNDPDNIPRLLEDEVLYDNLTPWPAEAAGLGQSLHRVSGLAPLGNLASSWSGNTPTPGNSDFAFVQPGDSNMDGRFDEHDIALAQQGGKYLSDQQATFQEGDWNGDGVFDQLDIVAALQAGNYGAVDQLFAALAGQR